MAIPRRTLLFLVAILGASIVAAGFCAPTLGTQVNSGDPDSMSNLQEIKVQTLAQSHAYDYVRELSDGIGPRLTGSPQAAAACDWAVQKMKRTGLQNVHLENWSLSRGWQRGHAFAQLTLPFQLGLSVASYGWVGSTQPGGVQADVVLVNSDLIPDEIKQHASKWKGKVLFLAPVGPKHLNPIRSYSQLESLILAAQKAKAVALIDSTGRPGPMLNHTGPPVFHDAYFQLPVVDIAPEHQQLIQRLLVNAKRVRIKIDVQNTVTTHPVACSNVVGDIPGYEHPEEIVILGAHLDCWDLGTGSIDDGFGVASVLGAADSIVFQHIRPRRTIRFVLFTGEEQGLLGSLAYVKAHKAEAKNTVCAFVLDWGSGPVVKLPLAGHDELEPAFRHFADLVSDLAQVQVDHTYLSFTDGYAFTLAGIPGIAPLQDSPNYVTIGHSGEDTLDKVDRKHLLQDVAFMAVAGFWVANYPTRLGIPWSQQRTINALTRDNQKTLLELFDLWPALRAK